MEQNASGKADPGLKKNSVINKTYGALPLKMRTSMN